ncbi:LTA synthase family protein [Carnobacterium gallinarum]|uniref:LTA synthase family protein n=1 Tax=Carnobacterium gallinarum TaxID=2749 RepID=UPI000558A6A8|nr:LTA synthase family protein [Carnobacterium gallinarum]
MIVFLILLFVFNGTLLITGRWFLYKQKDKFSTIFLKSIQWLMNGIFLIVNSELLLSTMYPNTYHPVIFEIGVSNFILTLIIQIPFYLLIYGFLGFYIGNALLTVLTFILGVSNYVKFTLQGLPLFIWDFLSSKMVTDVLFNMVLKEQLLITILSLILLTAMIWGLKKLFYSWHFPTENWKLRGTLAAIGCISMVFFFFNFEQIYSKFNIQAAEYNKPIQKSYQENGFVLSFLGNSNQHGMVMPANYSKETVAEAVTEIKNKMDAINKPKVELIKEQRPNIIFILSEAFWDPTTIKEAEWTQDPIPTIHGLMETSGGYLFSPEFGGSTANVEWNVLTGFSSNFTIDGYIQYNRTTQLKQAPSIVEPLKSQGYQAIALHDYQKEYYYRTEVYKKFGFSEFISETEMTHHDTNNIGTYISDASIFKEAVELIDKKGKDNPMLLHMITMQNHYPYTSNSKFGQIDYVKNKEALVDGDQFNLYINGLADTDKAVKELLTSLEKVKRPTYVVFYGDHLPSLNNEFYEHATFNTNQNQVVAKHETSYFVWKNDGEKLEVPSEVISPNYIAGDIMERSGLHQTIFQQYTTYVQNKIPAFNKRVYLDKKGNSKKLTNDEEELLDRYYLIQYDMMYGEQYSSKIFEVES